MSTQKQINVDGCVDDEDDDDTANCKTKKLSNRRRRRREERRTSVFPCSVDSLHRYVIANVFLLIIFSCSERQLNRVEAEEETNGLIGNERGKTASAQVLSAEHSAAEMKMEMKKNLLPKEPRQLFEISNRFSSRDAEHLFLSLMNEKIIVITSVYE